MSAFGGLILTNKGRNLQAKAQVGAQLNFTRIAIGDGDLDGTSILDLNALRHEVKSLSITKLKTMTGGKAVVGTTFSNQDITSGFYWRELGVFAQDPELGEILYCYGNSGANAEYIPAGGGPDTIEKSIDVVTIVGNTSSVTASIDQSLIYASQQDLTNIQNQIPTNISQLNNDVGYITQAPVQSVNGKIGKVTLTASDVGAVNKAGDYMTGSLTVPNLITQINIPSSSPPSAWPVGFVAGVVYNNGYPARYGTIFSYKGTSGNSCVQILQEWPGNDGGEAYLYIRSARDTGADVFGPWRKVWSENNDGTGSGLDADLLDGLHASSFVNKAGDTMTGRLIVPAGDSGGIAFPNDAFGGSGDTASITLQNPSGSENQELIIQVTNDATDIVHIKTPSDNGVKINNNTVWHAGNDGAGSGLDADMVDGLHVSDMVSMQASDNIFYDDTTIVAITTTTATKIKEYKLISAGSLRIKLTISFSNATSPSNTTVYTQIYRNGTAVGTLRTASNSYLNFTLTEDIANWQPGDLVQIYAYTNTTASSPALSDVSFGGLLNPIRKL